MILNGNKQKLQTMFGFEKFVYVGRARTYDSLIVRAAYSSQWRIILNIYIYIYGGMNEIEVDFAVSMTLLFSSYPSKALS